MINREPFRRSPCQVRLNLMYQIRTATDLVDAIRNEQLAAAAQGHRITDESDSERPRQAIRRETSLIEMLGKHLNEHGC